MEFAGLARARILHADVRKIEKNSGVMGRFLELGLTRALGHGPFLQIWERQDLHLLLVRL